MNSAHLEQFLQERIHFRKVNRKAGILSGGCTSIKRSKTKITVISEVPFSKKYLKNNLFDWLHVAANSEEIRNYVSAR